jgi:MFS transporter, DHA1 family, multidrug resistance protein
VARRQIVVLGALSAFGPLSIDMYLPGLPSMSHDLSASASAAQLTVTACLIGLGVGQLLAGPVSDALGRRPVLLVGLAAYVVASLACAAAPTVWALVAVRFVQGLAGAVGIVLARAIVRDGEAGAALARTYAVLFAINSVAPVLAPIVGGQLLHVTDWRGVFVVLAGVGVLLLAAGWRFVSETLAPALRRRGGVHDALASARALLAQRQFVGCVLCGAFAYGAMFAYIAGSPFVLQEIHGVSPQGFSLLFALNATGILVASRIGARLVGRVGTTRVLAMGMHVCLAGALVVLVAVLGDLGLAALLVGLFFCVASVGMVVPNAAALAMAGHPSIAGTASALFGLAGFGLGGLVAPLVGVGGAHDATPMAVVMAASAAAGVAVLWAIVARERNPRPPAPRESLLLGDAPPPAA